MRAALTRGGEIQLERLMNQTPVYHFDDAGVLIGEVRAARLVRLARPDGPAPLEHLALLRAFRAHLLGGGWW